MKELYDNNGDTMNYKVQKRVTDFPSSNFPSG